MDEYWPVSISLTLKRMTRASRGAATMDWRVPARRPAVKVAVGGGGGCTRREWWEEGACRVERVVR